MLAGRPVSRLVGQSAIHPSIYPESQHSYSWALPARTASSATPLIFKSWHHSLTASSFSQQQLHLQHWLSEYFSPKSSYHQCWSWIWISWHGAKPKEQRWASSKAESYYPLCWQVSFSSCSPLTGLANEQLYLSGLYRFTKPPVRVNMNVNVKRLLVV